MAEMLKKEPEQVEMPEMLKKEPEQVEMPEMLKKEPEQVEILEMHKKRPKKYYLAGIVPAVFLALAFFTFFITGELREKQAEQKAEKQYQRLLSEAEFFEEKKWNEKAAKERLLKAGFQDITVKQILEGRNGEQQSMGTVYELSSKSGYGGALTLLIGMNESDVICGIMVKDTPEIVKTLTKGEMESFLEQFLYGRKDKAFRMEEQMFGGQEIVKMESAPVTSREIVRMVNGCRHLAENPDALAGGQEND